MNIFHYSPLTGVFLGSSIADQSPIEKGVFLIPAHATDIIPPTLSNGERAVFFDGVWKVEKILGLGPEPQKPFPTTEQLAAAVRAERDVLMAAFQWRIDRYNSEVRLGLTPTDDIAVLDAYMQALRDVTKQSKFPKTVTWPKIPA